MGSGEAVRLSGQGGVGLGLQQGESVATEQWRVKLPLSLPTADLPAALLGCWDGCVTALKKKNIPISVRAMYYVLLSPAAAVPSG